MTDPEFAGSEEREAADDERDDDVEGHLLSAADPGAADPGAADPGAADPGAADPGFAGID